MKKLILLILFINMSYYSQWIQSSLPVSWPTDIVFFDNLNGLVMGIYTDESTFQDYLQTFRTENGGDTWIQVSDISMGEKFYTIDSLSLFIYGGNKLFKSNDRGKSWDLEFEFSGNVIDIIFIDSSLGYLILKDKVFHSINGGLEWDEIDIPSEIQSEYKMLHFINSDTGWVATSEWPDQTFLWTFDGGTSWTKKNVSISKPIYKPKSFATPLIGYIKTGANGIYKTIDGGFSWEDINRSFGYQFEFIENMQFLNENLGFIGGEFSNSESDGTIHPKVYKTTDGGITWSLIFQHGSTWTGVDCMFFLDENYGWVCPANGLFGLFRTTTGGLTDINEVVHELINKKPIIFQNYPNPFNPTTTINYSVRESGFVQLKVYDVLGKEIVTLVEGEKSAGNFSVKFNGNNLTSGVYFYKIESGNFTKVNKMLLLK